MNFEFKKWSTLKNSVKDIIKTKSVKVEKLPNVINENLAAENFRLVWRGINSEYVQSTAHRDFSDFQS